MAKALGYFICQEHHDSLPNDIRDRYKCLYGFNIVEKERCLWCKAEKSRELHQEHGIEI